MKDTPSYQLYKQLALYGERFRREGKRELGWQYIHLANLALKGHDWMHTCWHGEREHIQIYLDILLVLQTLWQVKVIPNAAYFDFIEPIESILKSLRKTDETFEWTDEEDER